MYGVRYTELLRLLYFDIVQQHFVDPVHNLFLGSGKYLMSLWKEEGIFDREQLENIQDQVNDIQAPATIGWISHKTMSVLLLNSDKTGFASTLLCAFIVLSVQLPV